jgi:hypothetical protein
MSGDSVSPGRAAKTGRWPAYLPRAGLYIGIIGAVGFIVFASFYLKDYTHRFPFMAALIPVPFIALLIARKLPLIGGLLLAALSVAAFILNVNFPIGIIGQVAGIGQNHSVAIGYTVIFVFLPLLASGVLFLLSGRAWGR